MKIKTFCIKMGTFYSIMKYFDYFSVNTNKHFYIYCVNSNKIDLILTYIE